MSNQTRPEGQATSEPETPAEAPGPPDPTGAAKLGPSAPFPEPMSDAAGQLVLDRLVAENAELKDKLLRAHAEMENIRKRTDREKAEAHKYAVTRFARDIVSVGDNFQRAIESVPPAAAEQDPALKSFLEGVTVTERELLNTLERHGIRRIDPKGQLFNPHHHQAVSELQNPEVPTGTVVQVFQCGYMIDERVLRPAMVVVAKGGAKPARGTDNGDSSGTEPQPSTQAANDDVPSPDGS